MEMTPNQKLCVNVLLQWDNLNSELSLDFNKHLSTSGKYSTVSIREIVIRDLQYSIIGLQP